MLLDCLNREELLVLDRIVVTGEVDDASLTSEERQSAERAEVLGLASYCLFLRKWRPTPAGTAAMRQIRGATG